MPEEMRCNGQVGHFCHPIRLAALRYQARTSSRHAGVIEATLVGLHQ